MKEISNQLRVHRFLSETESEGPGLRSALWVQGCPIRCPGCFNQDTWDLGGGEFRSVQELFETVRETTTIEGISFLGGEPFTQAGPLAQLARLCRSVGLSVVTFSGYSWENLKKSGRSDWKELLDETDLLLAGPFLQHKTDLSRPWVGSENQEFIFLTERYRDLDSILHSLPNRIEAHVGEDGSLSLNGLALSEEISELESELLKLGLKCTPN